MTTENITTMETMETEKDFNIALTCATINSGIIPENSDMTPETMEEMAHFVALSTMRSELTSNKNYKLLVKHLDGNTSDDISSADVIERISANPTLFGFKNLEAVGKAQESLSKVNDIDSDLQLLENARNEWVALENEGDRLVIYAYAHTMYNKVCIPSFSSDKGGLKKIATLVAERFQTADLSDNSKLLEVRKSIQAFWNYAYTKNSSVFKAMKIKENDIPAEIVLNFIASCRKGAKVEKDSGDYWYSYQSNKKKLGQALTEAFSACLISRLDSFELSEPDTQIPESSDNNQCVNTTESVEKTVDVATTPENPVEPTEKTSEPENTNQSTNETA